MLIKKVFTKILALVLIVATVALLLIGGIIFPAKILIDDEAKVTEWILHPDVRKDSIEIISETILKDSSLSLIINEEVEDNPDTERIISELIANIYKWLRGEEEDLSVALSTLSDDLVESLDGYSDSIQISSLIDTSRIEELLLNELTVNAGREAFLDAIPKAYQTFIKIDTYLKIAIVIALCIVFLTSNSVREGLFKVGITATIAGALIKFTLFKPEVAIDLLSRIPAFSDLKNFNLPELNSALAQIVIIDYENLATQYSTILLVAGLAVMLLSQIKLMSREIEYTEVVKEDNDNDDEEDEEIEIADEKLEGNNVGIVKKVQSEKDPIVEADAEYVGNATTPSNPIKRTN